MTASEQMANTASDHGAEPIHLVIAFDDFYRREFPAMVDLAYALSGSRLAAEDLAQDAMIAAHRQWERVGSLDKPGAWVRRVVINKAASLYHRRRAEMKALLRLAPLRGSPPSAMNIESEHVWVEVRRLPRRQGQVIALFYLGGMSIAEVAAVLECAEGTVKAHLYNARATLAQRLDEGDGT